MLERKNIPRYFVVISLLIAFTFSPIVSNMPIVWADSQTLLFEAEIDGNTEIYVLDVATKQYRNLTNSEARDTDFEWSPDGNHIAFVSFRDVTNTHSLGNIYVINSDGTNLQRISNIGSISPTWSPDGMYIAFSSQYGIYIVGSDLHEIADNPTYSDKDVIWSPDGKYIAFISSQGFVQEQDIYIVNLENKKTERLTSDKASVAAFRWSPDSRSIAFSSSHSSQNQRSIFIVQVETKVQMQLTSMAGYSDYPVWSPDGETLLFINWLSSTKSLYLINANTAEQKRLTEGKLAVWSPNGQQIVFAARKNGSDAIYSMYIDGTNTQVLLDHLDNVTIIRIEWKP